MKYNIKITNKTDYLNLRPFMLRCIKEHLKYRFLKQENYRNWNVHIEYHHKAKWIGGHAWLNSNSFTIKLPRTTSSKSIGFQEPFENENGELNDYFMNRFAIVVFHEMDHCIGKKHKDMISPYCSNPYPTLFSKEYKIVRREIVKKSKPTTEDKILAQILNLEKRKILWESKQKRVDNALKKINSQLKYYEKRKAAISKN